MKIYTYYEDIGFEKQTRMVELWKESWSKENFEPIVLTLKHAKQSPFYIAFNRQIKKIHLEIKGEEIQEYGLSCYNRWLAYSNMQEESFYVSDYDVLNNGFIHSDKLDNLTFLNGACPSIAFGKPSQFLSFCNAIVKVSTNRMNELRSYKEKMYWYHDQEFLQYNFIEKFNAKFRYFRKYYNICISRDLGQNPTDEILCKAPHISHSYTDKQKTKINWQGDLADLRIKLMENIISRNKK